MSKVICTDASGFEGILTAGKAYRATETAFGSFYLTGDNGRTYEIRSNRLCYV